MIGHATFAARRGTFTLAVRVAPRGRAMLRHRRRHMRVTLTLVLAGGATRKVDAILRG